MNTLICGAIRNREEIKFYYDGGFRTGEPHCHGVSTAGNEVLRAYQTGGHSTSGNSVGWKLFKVKEMSQVVATGKVFTENRPRHNPEDSMMNRICCRV
jgi:hypothetical protein